MTKTRIIVLLSSALVVGACGDEESSSAGPAAPAPAVEPTPSSQPGDGPRSDTPLPEQMEAHFVEATSARDAIIRGDADAARAAFATLAEIPPTASYPPSWSPQLAPFRAAAARASHASDLDALALEMGRLTNTCADCHRAVGAELQLDESTTPPSAADPATHMQRHQWAAARMWEGLMAPADDRYTAGAGALVEAPLEPSNIAENQTVPAEVAALAERVHMLGRNASAASDPTQRAQFYGELLATCASCHQQVPGAPGAVEE